MAGVGRTAALIQLNSEGKPELIGPDNPLYVSGGGGGGGGGGGWGGGGHVASVNGQTGTVVLDAEDVGAVASAVPMSIVWLTQTEYDAIPSPSDDIEYHILADE